MSAPHVKREEQFKGGEGQGLQRGIQQERDRFVGRIRGLTRGRDQVPSWELLALVDEVSAPLATASVSELTSVDEEFKALVQRVASALDAYQRYVPGSHVTANMDNDDETAEFIIASTERWLIVTVERFAVGVKIFVSSKDDTMFDDISEVDWTGEDEPWVQLLRRHIDWLRSP